MAAIAPAAVREQSFWQKMALGIALFIAFGFMQFAARGFVDYRQVPLLVHAHGGVMLGWLALTVVQPFLAQHNLALHRSLGWLGLVLAVGVVGICSSAGIAAVQTQHQPPFFTPAYFLALTQIGIVTFAGLVGAAIVRRKQTAWHRRLMLGSTILIMEPALGRVLPMPLIMPWGEWLTLAIQLGVLTIVMRHDKKVLGHIHPATIAVALIITLSHVVIELLAITPPWIALADSLAGG